MSDMTIERIEAMPEHHQLSWWNAGWKQFKAAPDVTTARHDDLIAELYFLNVFTEHWSHPDAQPETRADYHTVLRYQVRKLTIEIELRQRALASIQRALADT